MALIVAAAACIGIVLGARVSTGAVRGDVRLALTVNCKGLLETCGCPSDKAGGLPEKAALLEQYRREGVPLVVLDAGDAIEATDLPEKAEVLVRAMAAAGYHALNIGDQEAARGVEFLKHLESLTPMAFISANLVSAETREPRFKPFIIIEAGEARIGVLGVTAPGAGTELAALDAEEAVKRYLPQVRAQADAVVVLAHVSPAEGKRLAQIPGVDVVVGGDQRAQVPDPELIGGALWIQPPSYGRYLAVVRLRPEGERLRAAQWRIATVPYLGARHPQVASIVGAYQAKQESALIELLSKTGGQHEGYAGVEKCATCHAEIARSWEQSAHAQAWETLKRAGHRYDAECLPCHTTGDPGKPPSVALKGVQCEACHLPMAQHAQYDAGARREADTDWKPICTRCHNDERSPDFDLAARLARVRH